MRELVLERVQTIEAGLGPRLLRDFIVDLVNRWRKAGRLLAIVSEADIDRLVTQLHKPFVSILSNRPGQEDVNRLIQQIAEKLALAKKVELNPELLTAKFHPLHAAYLAVTDVLGLEQRRCSPRCLALSRNKRDTHWRQQVRQLGYDIFSTSGGCLRSVCCRGTAQAGRREGPLGGKDRRRGGTGTTQGAPRGTGRCLVAPPVPLEKVQGRSSEGNGQRGAHAWLGQYLDPADNQPHRMLATGVRP